MLILKNLALLRLASHFFHYVMVTLQVIFINSIKNNFLYITITYRWLLLIILLNRLALLLLTIENVSYG